MQSYTITSAMTGYDRRRFVFRVLIEAAGFALLSILWDRLWPDPITFPFAAARGIIFALIFEPVSLKLSFPWVLAIDDDSITATYPLRKKSIRKSEIKMIREVRGGAFHRGGLLVSGYDALETRLWGGIFIPKALPTYESVRNLVTEWKHSSQKPALL